MKIPAVFHLLTILREESDAEHPMTQQRLAQRLEERFGVEVNRRTLKSYLDAIRAAGFPLNCSAKPRVLPDGTTEEMRSDWYLDPQFEVAELRLLDDLICSTPALPEAQRGALRAKLLALAPPTYRESPGGNVTYLHRPPAPQLFYTVDRLCEAMRRDCMVQFQYSGYEYDGGLQRVPRRRDDGTVRLYRVSPYEIVVSGGRHYLVGCKEPHRSLSHYRIDRIAEIELEDVPRLPIGELETRPHLPAHHADGLYMYAGERIHCKFLADRKILNDIIDWFGDAAALDAAEDGRLLVEVEVHPDAMEHWAMQYGRYVTILSPQSMRERLAEAARLLAEKYL